MEPTADDKLAASVFAVGIERGFVRRRDVVGWADRRIEEVDVPGQWLIDLSLSRHAHVLDLIGTLRRVAAGVDPVATCKAVYALLPENDSYTFDQAKAVADWIYDFTFECLNGDWSQELLTVTDDLADNFDFLREGYIKGSEADLIADVREFIRDHRDQAVRRLLHPVQWSPGEGPE